MEKHKDSDTVDQLNSFLRGELSAVETYRLALDKLENTVYRGTLLQCSKSHEDRVRLLTQAIVARDGTPADSSGAWGAFARLVESGAAALGERAAILALEQGEDHGRDDYRRDFSELEPSARQLLVASIIPEQERTHDAIRELKRQLAA